MKKRRKDRLEELFMAKEKAKRIDDIPSYTVIPYIKEKDLLGDCNSWGKGAESLTKKQAIYHMLKNENNIVECCVISSYFDYFHIKKGVLRGTTYGDVKLWKDVPWEDFLENKLIKFMPIQRKEKKKSLKHRVKELEQEVETLKYKLHQEEQEYDCVLKNKRGIV